MKDSWMYTVTDAVHRGEEVINNVWHILEHPTFPFVNLQSTTSGARNFPPYNILEDEEGMVRLELAVAGFTKDRLKVELEGNTLIIQGTAKPAPKPVLEKGKTLTETYRYRGISNSTFLRTFDMNVYTIIESVELKDGILVVTVSTKTPESTKRQSFDIK